MPGYSRRSKGVSASSRILAMLVLKPCDLVELTCQAGSKATQAVVHCLKRSHERAGNRVQKAVTAELLAQSVNACTLVQGLSAELSSIIWWPRRGVELYNVCPLHPEIPAAFASSKPLHVFDSLVGCGQALHEEEPGSTRDKLPRGVLTLAQGIRPSAKVNTRSVGKSARLTVCSCSFGSHYAGSTCIVCIANKRANVTMKLCVQICFVMGPPGPMQWIYCMHLQAGSFQRPETSQHLLH